MCLSVCLATPAVSGHLKLVLKPVLNCTRSDRPGPFVSSSSALWLIVCTCCLLSDEGRCLPRFARHEVEWAPLLSRVTRATGWQTLLGRLGPGKQCSQGCARREAPNKRRAWAAWAGAQWPLAHPPRHPGRVPAYAWVQHYASAPGASPRPANQASSPNSTSSPSKGPQVPAGGCSVARACKHSSSRGRPSGGGGDGGGWAAWQVGCRSPAAQQRGAPSRQPTC